MRPGARTRRSLAVLSMLGALAACEATGPVPGDGGSRYAPGPSANTSDASVGLGAASLGEGVTQVAGRLAAAGFRVQSADRTAGRVRATAEDPALVDCGVITQTIDGATVTVSGAAPNAVLVAFDLPGDLVRRQVSTRTSTAIAVAAGPPVTARIAEEHRVTIAQFSVDSATPIWTETRTFAGDATARFSDGTTCASSGALRQIID